MKCRGSFYSDPLITTEQFLPSLCWASFQTIVNLITEPSGKCSVGMSAHHRSKATIWVASILLVFAKFLSDKARVAEILNIDLSTLYRWQNDAADFPAWTPSVDPEGMLHNRSCGWQQATSRPNQPARGDT